MNAPVPNGSAAATVFASLEAKRARFGLRRLKLLAVLALIGAFYAMCFSLAQVDPAKLAEGLPKLAGWLAQAWPPRGDELPLIVPVSYTHLTLPTTR